eukprot:2604133-Rhodomonas_salina.3
MAARSVSASEMIWFNLLISDACYGCSRVTVCVGFSGRTTLHRTLQHHTDHHHALSIHTDSNPLPTPCCRTRKDALSGLQCSLPGLGFGVWGLGFRLRGGLPARQWFPRRHAPWLAARSVRSAANLTPCPPADTPTHVSAHEAS